ncbi:TPA: hypothetical protein DCY43_00770 [candidate division WWE3 bacterium]|uniref:Uncharacterized protein n=3 Tax=Katanobacteria TaxID=422282 RepID=A0A0G1HFU8_UNCKA|nr:MAG: hypothetical protein UW36_C0001G0058 [candidate division WWE3 bacterium GW2011_GWA2_44_16]HAZ29274.1 hypothetical protein [candidate division WWE3 bacterium]
MPDNKQLLTEKGLIIIDRDTETIPERWLQLHPRIEAYTKLGIPRPRANDETSLVDMAEWFVEQEKVLTNPKCISWWLERFSNGVVTGGEPRDPYATYMFMCAALFELEGRSEFHATDAMLHYVETGWGKGDHLLDRTPDNIRSLVCFSALPSAIVSRLVIYPYIPHSASAHLHTSSDEYGGLGWAYPAVGLHVYFQILSRGVDFCGGDNEPAQLLYPTLETFRTSKLIPYPKSVYICSEIEKLMVKNGAALAIPTVDEALRDEGFVVIPQSISPTRFHSITGFIANQTFAPTGTHVNRNTLIGTIYPLLADRSNRNIAYQRGSFIEMEMELNL